jgi:diacylglycerol kinase family enzyme
LNKIGLGKLTYIIIALKQVLSCPFMDCDITINNTHSKSYQKVFMITGMIHKYEGGGMKIVPTADPYDGKMSVCIVHGLSKKKILLILPTILFGKHVKFKGIDIFDCNTLTIDLHKPAIIHVDGEYPGSFQHTEISCTSKQLRIMI